MAIHTFRRVGSWTISRNTVFTQKSLSVVGSTHCLIQVLAVTGHQCVHSVSNVRIVVIAVVVVVIVVVVDCCSDLGQQMSGLWLYSMS